MHQAQRHACRVCGFRTILVTDPAPSAGPPGTGQICPVCHWEDTPAWADEIGEFTSGVNEVTLHEAQRNFVDIGAAGAPYRASVRPPLPQEARDPDWRSFDQQELADRADLLRAIAHAFADVSRDGGVSLHETAVIDGYGGPGEAAQARALDRDRVWQEVPHAELEAVSGVGGIVFLDPVGWRYYLPAYMTWLAAGAGASCRTIAAESLLSSLCPGPADTEELPRYRLLDARQAAAVAQFLRFVVRYVPSHRSGAEQALAAYWDARDSRDAQPAPDAQNPPPPAPGRAGLLPRPPE